MFLPTNFTHEYWMRIALEEAQIAFTDDEVPIGAVLVKENTLVSQTHNLTNKLQNPLAHAEKLLIDKIISQKIKYLYDYTLYVTLEPCIMCAGYMIWSRLGRLVYGSKDPKAGAVGSVYNVLKDKSFNHHPSVISGILADECSLILRDFFRLKR